MLAHADAVVGAHGLNVDGQVLATRGELGYAVAVRLSTFARPPAASALDGLS